jgi:hypothetical protein
MSPDKGNLTVEEVLQRKNCLKVAPAFIMEYIKVGTEWKVFKPETVEIKRIEQRKKQT